MLSLLAGVAGSFAHEVGDYVYTIDGRFKILEANALPNGDFSNGTDGWTNIGGGALSGDTLEVVDDEALGKKALYVRATYGSRPSTTNPLTTGSANFYRSYMLDRGQYIISYKVKGAAESSTTSTCSADAGSYSRGANFQSIYRSDVPTVEVVGTKSDRQISHYVTYRSADGWTEVSYFVNLDQAQNVNFLFYNLQLNDAFADFSINLCQRALDDREVRNIYNQWKVYVDAAGPSAQDPGGFMDYYNLFGGFLEDPNLDPDNFNPDDPNAIQNMLDGGGNEALTAYLDANSVDVSKYLRNFTFDNGSYSGWTVDGDRWKVAEPTGNFSTQFVYTEYPGNYTLGEGQMSQSCNLPAGKYVYVVQAQAYKFFIDGRGSSNNQQIIDWYNSIENCRMFLGDQSLTLTNLPTYTGAYYAISADMPAGLKTVGFYDSGSAAEGDGGHHRFDNIALRIFGVSAADVTKHVFENGAYADLVSTRDSAQTLSGIATYPFGKDALNDSIANANAYINAKPESPTDDDIAEAQDLVSMLDGAIKAYYTINAEYTAFGQSIADAQAAYDDESLTAGKAELQAAITTATNYYNELQQTHQRDSAAIMAAIATLSRAVGDYNAANAGYNFPGEVAIVNPTFADGATGWTVVNDADNKEVMKFGADENFDGGYKAYVNRGNTTAPGNSVLQTVTLNYPGMYELTFQAYANPQGSSHEGTGLQDTINVFFITEKGGKRDSLMLHTAPVDGNYYIPEDFKVRVFVEEGEAPVDLTFGIDALNNTSSWPEVKSEVFATNYAFGSNKLSFYGDYDKYLQDSIQAAILPTRDSLQRAVDAANALLAESRNPNKVSTTPFEQAIATAQGVVNNGSASLDELNAQFPLLEAATRNFMVSGVYPAAGKYYDLTFMIKNADFTSQDAKFADWTTSGVATNFTTTSTGYVYYYNNVKEGTMATTAITQAVSGLPNGQYQFQMGLTYRISNPAENQWNADAYGTTDYAYVTANDAVQPANGLLMEGAQSQTDANVWDYGYGVILTNYDYRHAAGTEALFDAGCFGTAVSFAVTDGTATVGMMAEGLPTTSYVYMKGMQLRFWGDEVADGINAAKGFIAAAPPADIYTLSGVKVRSNATSFDGLAKGIYIKNGKKVVVK